MRTFRRVDMVIDANKSESNVEKNEKMNDSEKNKFIDEELQSVPKQSVPKLNHIGFSNPNENSNFIPEDSLNRNIDREEYSLNRIKNSLENIIMSNDVGGIVGIIGSESSTVVNNLISEFGARGRNVMGYLNAFDSSNSLEELVFAITLQKLEKMYIGNSNENVKQLISNLCEIYGDMKGLDNSYYDSSYSRLIKLNNHMNFSKNFSKLLEKIVEFINANTYRNIGCSKLVYFITADIEHLKNLVSLSKMCGNSAVIVLNWECSQQYFASYLKDSYIILADSIWSDRIFLV